MAWCYFRLKHKRNIFSIHFKRKENRSNLKEIKILVPYSDYQQRLGTENIKSYWILNKNKKKIPFFE